MKKKIREENLSFVLAALDLRWDIDREIERMRRVNGESKVRRLVTSLNARIRWANATNVAGPSTTFPPWTRMRGPGSLTRVGQLVCRVNGTAPAVDDVSVGREHASVEVPVGLMV